ncbi:MAG: hypothetical protein ACRBDX_08435 [Gammaproteobacteria bacterium]
MNQNTITAKGLIAVIWAIIGLLALLVFACWRLSAYTIGSFQYSLNWMHWLVFVAWAIFMAHGEGYKGFQLKFSPRFAARCKYLYANGTWLQTLLAPLFCMAYFHAPKKRVIATFALTIMIIIFIFAFRLIPQPWKGLLDFGVVLGLAWGIVSTLYFCFMAFTDENFSRDNEVLITS